MIEKAIKLMIEYYGNDVPRINHSLKVHGFASTIARLESQDKELIEVTELAAVLHDIGIPESEKKYQSSAGKYQEIEGPPIARKMLESLKIRPEIIDRVCYLVGNHHSYARIDGLDFQVLVEADFLVNIFEDEMSSKVVSGVREKYFKTESGRRILEGMIKK